MDIKMVRLSRIFVGILLVVFGLSYFPTIYESIIPAVVREYTNTITVFILIGLIILLTLIRDYQRYRKRGLPQGVFGRENRLLFDDIVLLIIAAIIFGVFYFIKIPETFLGSIAIILGIIAFIIGFRPRKGVQLPTPTVQLAR